MNPHSSAGEPFRRAGQPGAGDGRARDGVVAPTTPVAQIGAADRVLADDEVRGFLTAQLDASDFDRRSVCVLVPDATRSCPLPLLLSTVHAALHRRVRALTVLVALGTHAAMDPLALASHLGYEPGRSAERYPDMTVRNHAWWDPTELADVGSIPAARVAELSAGMLREGTRIRINRAVLEHDTTLILGPVFPHEVVGFSGGNKYLFPGVSGRELIDVSHWLGALLTSSAIIGTRGQTPVRALIDEAASMVPGERLACCVVTARGRNALHLLAYGDPLHSWAAAVDVSAEAHIRYLDAPVPRVLSVVPRRYDDLWTGAKGFYKVEPVVADGGEVVLYAPHIREVSAMHPDVAEVGYHCRDYFVQQWDRFRDFSWGDLAHATHLRGAGTYDAVHGERDRVRVTLATGIPEEVVRAVNLDYLDPRGVDLAAWAADPATLVVEDAGEDLYRLR